jgi:hypothetical protein
VASVWDFDWAHAAYVHFLLPLATNWAWPVALRSHFLSLRFL